MAGDGEQLDSLSLESYEIDDESFNSEDSNEEVDVEDSTNKWTGKSLEQHLLLKPTSLQHPFQPANSLKWPPCKNVCYKCDSFVVCFPILLFFEQIGPIAGIVLRLSGTHVK